MNKKFKPIPTAQINSEIKFLKMKISTIIKIKKALVNLHTNISKIHLKKLFSLQKRSTINNIKARKIQIVK